MACTDITAQTVSLRAARKRIKELEASLRNILSESKSKAYSPEILQSYAEQALKEKE